ncbi:MAG: DUF21 domain-containing protein [Planctomycetes bacterium]|nr:DUF21 domain-containing protein [Planctomycetota bacterium]
MFGLLFVLGLCLILSFLVSMWEGALSAIRSTRIEGFRQEGTRSAAALARLRERIDETTIVLKVLDLASNAGVLICAFKLSAQAAGAVGLQDTPLVQALLAAILVFCLFLLFDLLPRAIGAATSESTARRSALLLAATVRLFSPIVILGRAVMNIVPKRPAGESGPTDQDLLAMARSAARLGNLEAREARWVANALKLGEVTVRQILTPRTVVYALPAEMPLSMVKSHSEHWAHSRLPIFRERNPDDIVGIVLRRTVFDKLLQGSTRETLEELSLPALSVPDSMTLDNLLEWFVSRHQHLAVVRDEMQAWIGIVTLEDVLETFLGAEIVDEKDKVVDMQELARKRAAERGMRVTTIVARPSKSADAPSR